MQKHMPFLLFAALLLLIGCSAKDEPPIPPLEMAIVFDGNGTYTAADLVNISVFVKNNANATYTINISLERDNQSDYAWSTEHAELVSSLERWNIWKSYLQQGNWTVYVWLQPFNSSLVIEKNSSFIVLG